ncbi:MAG: hypothetical protein O7E52_27665 [Candidatus Poribacteria bacterium]|nr:hypothetical protein [Candidatus Poribacteria bacterium]
MPTRLAIIVLAGSDPFPGPIPRGLKQEDILTGYKGSHRLPWGRCLAGELVERVKESDRFEDPILIGPRRVYEGQVNCEIVDVDGNLMTTLRCAFEVIRSRFSPFSPIAFFSCDILPTPDEIRRLLETCYDPYQKCMFWWQLVEAQPDDLGASGWKPSYQIRPDGGQPPKNLFPGHLIIARPGALRTSLTSRILELMYRYRSRDIHKRHFPMIGRSLGRLVLEDFRQLFLFKSPVLSVSIPYHVLRACYKLRRQQMTVSDFEYAVGKTFLHREFHHSADGRPVVFSITRIASFAKDIDTKAELAEASEGKPCVSD